MHEPEDLGRFSFAAMDQAAELSPVQLFVNATLTLGVILLGTLGLNYLVGVRWAPRDNVSYLLEHADEFNVVFAGSSYLENMMDPRTFDAEMEKRGYRTHSFNAGRGGSSPHETNYVIRQLLKRYPSKLAFVIIDFSLFGLSTEFSGTLRYKSWHDVHETLSVLKTTRTFPGIEEEERRAAVRAHRAAILGKYSPIGKFFDIVAARRAEEFGPLAVRAIDRNQYYDQFRGYAPFSVVNPIGMVPVERRRRAFLEGTDGYHATLEKAKRLLDSPPDVGLEGIHLDAWSEQMRSIRAANAEPVYLLAPSLWGDPRLPRRLLREGILDRAIFVDDPFRFPQFFEPDARFDKHHIAEAMVPEYSRIVANCFADMLDANSELAAKLERVPPAN